MRLLSLGPEEIKQYIERLEEEADSIKSSALKFSWYMRGGASYNDILNMSKREREFISKLIDENLETTKKTQLPFF